MKNQLAAELIRKCQEEQSDFLDLGNCGLTEVPGEVFEMTHLKRLNLGKRFYRDGEWVNTENEDHDDDGNHNRIRHLPQELARLQNLEELSLEGNPIKEVGLLSRFPHLERLHLGRTGMKSLEILKDIPGLKALNIKSLELRSLARIAEFDLPDLIALDVSDNQLVQIERLEGFSRLEHLNLSINRICEIEGLDHLQNLKSLYLGLNWIREIKNLGALTQLEILSFGYLGGHYEKTVDSDYYRSNFIEEIKNLDILKKLRVIDLSGNLIREACGLESQIELESLYLGHNQIETLEPVANLETLRMLSMGFTTPSYEANKLLQHELFVDHCPFANQITQIKSVSYFPKLEYISLDFNQISEISDLDVLENLKNLVIDYNQIKEIKNLETLTNLEELSLHANQIIEINSLDALVNLQKLWLSSNQISEIKNLDGLPNLQSLWLDSNQLKEIENLDELTILTKLSLNNNNICEITGLEGLIYLQFLYLNKNKIRDAGGLNNLPLLAELYLNENRLTMFNIELMEGRNILRLFLAKNELVNIANEIINLDNCLTDAKAWFKDLAVESVENFEAKLMLVGNGRVGKTSILRRLFQDQFDPKEDSTHGIQLHDQKVTTEFCPMPLRIQTWDFGGQEIYHATHRLFMQSRALYFALWDWTTENQAYATEHIAGELVRFRNYELTYWLDHARALSWQSPLIVVQNKIDQDQRKWPKYLNQLQERYGIINFHHVSAATGEGISVLKSAMLEEFRKMPEVGMKTPGQWLRVKEKLLTLKTEHKTIDFSRYKAMCVEEGLDTSSGSALIRFLHNTGNLFYHPHLFQNQIILDQEWALEGMYALFQRGPFYKQLKYAGGRTSLDVLAWPWQNYDLNTRKIFLSMMESCEICFKVTEDERDPEYIITEFLPDKKDDKVSSFWEKTTENELFLKYQTNFFHPAFISRFIARAGRLAKSYDHIWRNGIWITFENAHALIEALPDEHQILVRVKGEPGVLLLYLIHSAFKEIFYDPDSVDMDVSLAGKEYLRYKSLKDGKTKGMKKIVSNSHQMVDLEKVEFFSEVLDARSENDVKRLADIVPQPKLKTPSPTEQEALSPEALKQLKGKIKNEIGKDLEKALESMSKILGEGDLKNQFILIQGRYANLKKFMSTGGLSFEEYDRNCNQIRPALMEIIDALEGGSIDVEKSLGYLG